MSTRYLVLNDPHVDIKAPSPYRIDDYRATCERKLAYIAQIIRERDIKLLVCTGDWFHRKNPFLVPYSLTNSLVGWSHFVTDECGCTLATIFGNHDVQYGRVDADTLSKSPAGALLSNPKVVWLDASAHLLRDDRTQKVSGVLTGSSFRPPIEVGGVVVEEPSQFKVQYQREAAGSDWHVHVAHANVVGHPTIWGPTTRFEDAMRGEPYDILHTGHIHDNLGVNSFEDGGTKKWWTNTGSMTRGSISWENLERVPNVLMVTLPVRGEGDPSFEEIPIQAEPSSAVFAVAEHQMDKDGLANQTSWVQHLRKEIQGEEETQETLKTLVEKSPLDYRAREYALRLIDSAGF